MKVIVYLFLCFGGEDDEDENFEENVISFKKSSKELKESELEIAVKDSNNQVIARISECDIEY